MLERARSPCAPRMANKKIYKYNQYFGRSGSLESVFTATEATINKLRAAGRIYLGECLGKHSEVSADDFDKTIVEVSDDRAVVKFLDKHFQGVIGVDLVGTYQDLVRDGVYTED